MDAMGMAYWSHCSPVFYFCGDLSEDNFLVQCHGTKRVCLFPPDCAKHLYVNSKYDSGTLCCDVNVFEPETWIKLLATPLKTNMDKNDGLEKVTPFKNCNFGYLC